MDPFQSLEVVNRRKVTYETMFDGRCIVFGPREKRSYPQAVARCIVEQSALRLNLASGVPSTYALGITGDKFFTTDALDGEIATENPVELLDRTDDHLLTQTEPKTLGPDGEESMGIGKSETAVPSMPGNEPPPAKEMKAKRFVNTEVRRGPQNGGDFEGRISAKNG